jgi:SEC-C motif domain protein
MLGESTQKSHMNPDARHSLGSSSNPICRTARGVPTRICQALDVDGLLGPLCPCGSDANYRACCGPFHHGELQARSAEELMRSRYSAYACGDADYLFRTWHPRTRPVEVVVDPRTVWTGLEVIDTVAGGPDDDRGEVEFRARFESEGRARSLHERSRFERRAGRWFYVDPVTEDV